MTDPAEAPHPELRLYEQVLLLLLDDSGTHDKHGQPLHLLVAAANADLLLAGRITTTDAQGRRHVQVLDGSTTGDTFLDACLSPIAAARRPASLTLWIKRQARSRDVLDHATKGLVGRGVLRTEEHTTLGLLHRRRYPVHDPDPKTAVLARLSAAVLSDTRPVDRQTCLLVALTHTSGLLARILGKDAVRTREDRIAQLAGPASVGEELARALHDVRASLEQATSSAVESMHG